MIRFEQSPEPSDFDIKARQAGIQWLQANPDVKRPKDFWTPFKPQLADAFKRLCAYTAVYEPIGTVDHFISVDEDKKLAYEWGNYRFAAQWINSSKKNAVSILDPFEVGDDWFEIILPSLQLVTTSHIPPQYRDKAIFTLKRLHLQNDERVIRVRQTWYQEYRNGEITLDFLHKKAPLIARAIEKQQQESQSL